MVHEISLSNSLLRPVEAICVPCVLCSSAQTFPLPVAHPGECFRHWTINFYRILFRFSCRAFCSAIWRIVCFFLQFLQITGLVAIIMTVIDFFLLPVFTRERYTCLSLHATFLVLCHAGFFRDMQGSYDNLYRIMSGLMFLNALVWLVVNLTDRFRKKRTWTTRDSQLQLCDLPTLTGYQVMDLTSLMAW